jgi:hypothetical protein
MYTFWDYMRNRWERDSGLRLDHIPLSFVLTKRLQGTGVDRHIRGREDASDHAPVGAEFHDARNRARSASPVGSHATTTGATASPKGKKSAHGIGGGVKSQTRAVRKPELSRRPLLVIDGDSFAHRSYHALPKTIGNAAGAMVGFANFLLRFYAEERPRAVIVGWDSLDAPTKREMFPAYQSGRESDEELIEQLMSCPNLSPPLGLRTPKPQGSRRTTFSPPRSPLRSAQAGPHWWQMAIEIPFNSPHYVQ